MLYVENVADQKGFPVLHESEKHTSNNEGVTKTVVNEMKKHLKATLSASEKL